MSLLHEDITDGILKAFFTVYNELGYGFPEKVYERSLAFELRSMGYIVETQVDIKVFYKEHCVGEYTADMVVNRCVVVELKAAESIVPANVTQLQNYLRATNIEVGLLLNFGKKSQFERKVFQSARSYPS